MVPRELDLKKTRPRKPAQQAPVARWSFEGAHRRDLDDTPLGIAQIFHAVAVDAPARDQLPARIDRLESSGPVVRAWLRLGEEGQIAARITQESVQLLGLEPGMPVIALCKATAVKVARAADAEAARSAKGPVANRLEGSVTRVARGDSGDEITLALSPGLQLVGFAPAGSGLRSRQRVAASVDESAVVVALGAVSMAAGYLPARRAANLDPTEALRIS